MIIREFKLKDQDDVISLWEQCGLVVPWNNPKLDIERKCKVNPELFLVGEQNGKIIASAMGGYEGHRGWINYLAVDSTHRRKGMGRAIMAEIENRLRAIGCPKINLQVRESNKEIIAFYQAIGFKNDNVIGMGKRLIVDEPYSKE